MTGHLFSSPWQSSLTLVLEAVAVMGTPGPSTMAVMATAAAFGVRRALGFVSGAIAGTIAVLLAVATGVVALLISIQGLGFLLTLASLSKQTADAAAPSLAAGFLLAIANPKAWFAIAAVFTGSTLLESSRELDALLKAAVLAVMIVLIHLCWLLGGVSLAGFLRDPLRSRIVNVLFGLILVGTTALALIG